MILKPIAISDISGDYYRGFQKNPCFIHLIDQKAIIRPGDWFINNHCGSYTVVFCDKYNAALVNSKYKTVHSWKIIASNDPHVLPNPGKQINPLLVTRLSEYSVHTLAKHYESLGKFPEFVEVLGTPAAIFGNNGSVDPILYVPVLNKDGMVDIHDRKAYTYNESEVYKLLSNFADFIIPNTKEDQAKYREWFNNHKK